MSATVKQTKNFYKSYNYPLSIWEPLRGSQNTDEPISNAK